MAEDAVFLSINTAGKALGVAGAFVAGPDWAIEIWSSAPARSFSRPRLRPRWPPRLEASLDVIEAEPERRERLLVLRGVPARPRMGGADSVRSRPPGRLQPDSQIIPVILGTNERALAAAAETPARNGFDVRAIRPPTVPAGTARLRISVNANLSEAIDRFAMRFVAVRGIFVTGTDTGVGKTVVSAALLCRYPRPRYWKPIQTGIETDDDTAEVRRLTAIDSRPCH